MRAQRRAQLRSRSDDRPRDIRTAFRPVPDIAALIPATLARTASLLRDAAGFNVQAGYAGSRAIRQNVIQNLNAAGPGGGNPGRALFPQFARISDIRA